MIAEHTLADVRGNVRVRVVAAQGGAVLVEWVEADGRVQRVSVPTGEIVAGEPIERETLETGIPYGVPWEDILQSDWLRRLANELRKAGIWTMADLNTKMIDARGAVLRAWATEVNRIKGGSHE